MFSKEILMILVMLVGFCPVQAVEYYITDIGTLGAHPQSTAYGINDYGQVVGYSGTVQGPEEGRRAFLWDSTAGMQDLGTLGGNHSEAYGINNAGQVVGRTTLPTGEWDVRGFLWEGGSMIDLGTFEGDWTEARGINNSGQVVGFSVLSSSVAAFSWEDDSMINLGSLGDNSLGYGINDAGLIVGFCSDSTSFSTAASLWDNGDIISLGSLGSDYNYAWAINNSGQIVGRSGIHAFLWENESDGMIDMGIGEAVAINDAGQIVGKSGGAACLWENGIMKKLDDLLLAGSGWELHEATAINNLGQIVGNGMINGEIHAYLLTPVPEPGTLALLGLGALVLRKQK
jgi:probable HAF family extracellular repeat protein